MICKDSRTRFFFSNIYLYIVFWLVLNSLWLVLLSNFDVLVKINMEQNGNFIKLKLIKLLNLSRSKSVFFLSFVYLKINSKY